MLTPYPLEFNDSYGYSFVTEQGLGYFIFFMEGGYLFEKYQIPKERVYLFNIENSSGGHDTAVGDERIGLTVFEVLIKFFAQQENVALFVCDSLDNRQRARKRKFDQWFFKFNDGSLIKENGTVLSDGIEYYSGMIIHKNNPHLPKFLKAFRDLHDDMNRKAEDS